MNGFKSLVFVLLFGHCHEAPELKVASADVSEVVIPELAIDRNDSEISKKNGIVFYKGKTFSGWMIEHFEKGRLKEKMPYFNGKREGKMESFYATGERNEIRFYEANKKSGTHKAWWPNGNLQFEYHFENGVFEGNCKEWFADKSMFKDFNYKNGKEEGSQRMWNAHGSLKANYVMKNGRRFGLIGSKPCYTVKNDSIQN